VSPARTLRTICSSRGLGLAVLLGGLDWRAQARQLGCVTRWAVRPSWRAPAAAIGILPALHHLIFGGVLTFAPTTPNLSVNFPVPLHQPLHVLSDPALRSAFILQLRGVIASGLRSGLILGGEGVFVWAMHAVQPADLVVILGGLVRRWRTTAALLPPALGCRPLGDGSCSGLLAERLRSSRRPAGPVTRPGRCPRTGTTPCTKRIALMSER